MSRHRLVTKSVDDSGNKSQSALAESRFRLADIGTSEQALEVSIRSRGEPVPTIAYCEVIKEGSLSQSALPESRYRPARSWPPRSPNAERSFLRVSRAATRTKP